MKNDEKEKPFVFGRVLLAKTWSCYPSHWRSYEKTVVCKRFSLVKTSKKPGDFHAVAHQGQQHPAAGGRGEGDLGVQYGEFWKPLSPTDPGLPGVLAITGIAKEIHPRSS